MRSSRRFNNRYGDTFPEPQAKLTEDPLIIGLDGHQKMSKSLDNHLELAATPETTAQRVSTAFTDPQRERREIPGRPEVCNVYSLHKIFSPPGDVPTVYDECTTAQRGCVDCKHQLADSINSYLEPFRERRREYEARTGFVQDVLEDGAKKARAIARRTLEEVYQKMGPGLTPSYQTPALSGRHYGGSLLADRSRTYRDGPDSFWPASSIPFPAGLLWTWLPTQPTEPARSFMTA